MQGSIRKRGSTWSWSFDLGYVNGKRKRKEKGGYRTKAECQTALREAIKQYENCGSVFEPSEITVADYINIWFKEHSKNIKYNTIRTYGYYISKHILPSIGSYKLKSITPVILQRFIDSLFQDGYSQSLVYQIVSILTLSFGKAVYPYQYIKENPTQYINMPKYKAKKIVIADKVISDEDFAKIIDYVKDGHYYIPFMLAYYTGFRMGECLSLTWDNVDFENNKITVNATMLYIEKIGHGLGTPKTETSNRTILVSQTLIDILKKHKKKQSENRLFYGQFYINNYLDSDNIIRTEQKKGYTPINMICTREDGSIIYLNTLAHFVKIIRRKTNVNFTFHSIRHTHATKLVESGANIKDVQYRLGHSNYSTTANTYSHVTEIMENETVTLFDKAVGNIK